MRLPRFECLEPKTIQEACSLLSQYKGKARINAGGTDLLVKMKNRETKPRYLIRLKNIPHLNYIEPDETGGLKIGTLSTLDDVDTSPLIKEKFDILTQVVQQMGSPQIRNLATIGGNLCNAAPSADTAPALIVMGAKLRLTSPTRERIVPLEEFFIGPEKTILGDEELLVEIRVPNPLPYSGGVYIKHTIRRAMDLAILSVAVMITFDTPVTCKDIKIALGAAAPTPIRAQEAENILRDETIDNKQIERVAQAAMDESRPRTSIRATAEYRRKMARVLTRRVVSQAWEKAKSAKP